jgi:hypothetical protein
VGAVRLLADSGAEIVLDAAWTYLDQSVITSFSPVLGANGTVVTIVGERLLGGGNSIVRVSLAGVAARSIGLASNTEVVVVADGSAATGAAPKAMTTDSTWVRACVGVSR